MLSEDPEILDVHIYGVPAGTGAAGDSHRVAAVVPRHAGTLDVAALFERCGARLGRSHVPYYVQVLDSLAKTAEKVQLSELLRAFDPDAPNVFSGTS